MPAHQRTHTHIAISDHHDPFQPFHNDTFQYHYIWQHKLSIQHHLILFLHFIRNVTDYWPLAREYLIWNTTVAALQFWTVDLEAHVLSSAIEQVYNAFFYTTSTHLLCQKSEEVLFGHFVTMLNAAFESKLPLEDEGYESGSENFNIPTPLRHTPRIHHVSSDENISFDPTTPHSMVPASHIINPYDASYHSVPLVMKTVPQMTFHLLTAPHHHRTSWVLHRRHTTSPFILCMLT